MKRLFILIMCLSFFIVGCKKEESEVGDIAALRNASAATSTATTVIDEVINIY